jgi:hypothetical protein
VNIDFPNFCCMLSAELSLMWTSIVFDNTVAIVALGAAVTGRRIGAVSAEPVAPILQCELCRRVWVPADKDRWRAYPTDDAGELFFFFCARVRAREFDD